MIPVPRYGGTTTPILAPVCLSSSGRTGYTELGMKARSEVVIDAVRFLAIPGILLVVIGPRVELLGIALGIGVLVLGRGNKFSAVAAGLIAVGTGFRIEFITDPAGGYLFLDWIAIPFTCAWIVLLIWAREGLRRVVPQRGPQLGFDLTLAVTILLLSFASPQTRESPIAASLPVATIAFVLLGLVRALRGGSVREDHAVVAFALGLFGISGAMKGAVSVSLLGPLVALGVPLFATARLGAVTGTSSLRLPSRSLLAWGIGAAGFAVAVVGFAQGHPEYALVVAGILFFTWGAYRTLAGVRADDFGMHDRRVYLFGIGFDPVTLDEATRWVEGMIRAGRAAVVVTPNSPGVIRALSDPVLRSSYASADLVIPDGIGVVWASRLFGRPLPARVTGVDLAARLLARPGIRVYLLGGRPGVAIRAADRLQAHHPGINIVGTHHGYFTKPDAVVERIAAARPDLVLVGMGVPQQERFMRAARTRVPGVMIGVGGALDLFAGDVPRAPIAWQKLGLEWCYRMIRQPRRVKAVVSIARFSGRALLAWAVLSFIRLSAQAD